MAHHVLKVKGYGFVKYRGFVPNYRRQLVFVQTGCVTIGNDSNALNGSNNFSKRRKKNLFVVYYFLSVNFNPTATITIHGMQSKLTSKCQSPFEIRGHGELSSAITLPP